MDKYCSSLVHLLRGRELGARNALTDNAKRCTKYKILQTCDNINDCNGLFNNRAYSLLSTCHYVNRGFRDENYNEEEEKIRDLIWIDTNVNELYYLYHACMFNVVKKYEDICIEIRSCLDGELQMTIDAKKIIPKLSVPLEDEE